MAFSPTNCSLVKVQDDGKVKWSKLHHPLGDIGNSNQDGTYIPSFTLHESKS